MAADPEKDSPATENIRGWADSRGVSVDEEDLDVDGVAGDTSDDD